MLHIELKKNIVYCIFRIFKLCDEEILCIMSQEVICTRAGNCFLLTEEINRQKHFFFKFLRRQRNRVKILCSLQLYDYVVSKLLYLSVSA